MKPSVLFLEDDPDLSSVLLSFVDLSGETGLAVHSVQELRDRLEEVLDCKVAFLDLDLGRGQPTGIDGFDWLREKHFAGQIYFLTGHGSRHPLVAQARSMEGVEDVLVKPVSAHRVVGILRGEDA